jgi:uncharacterized protein
MEWFANPQTPEQGQGLRFRCTQCGNCCSGSPGFVLVDDDECSAIAKRLGLSLDEFKARYTHIMSRGRSLNDLPHNHYDCAFLDRSSIPGKAVCGIYEDRPRQCKTWPFWPSLLASEDAWQRASRSCPGINTGPIHPLVQIRIARDTINI